MAYITKWIKHQVKNQQFKYFLSFAALFGFICYISWTNAVKRPYDFLEAGDGFGKSNIGKQRNLEELEEQILVNGRYNNDKYPSQAVLTKELKVHIKDRNPTPVTSSKAEKLQRLSPKSNSTTTSRNYSLCSSAPYYGPIRRIPHTTPPTLKLSICKVFGNGLRRAMVGESAKLTIRVPRPLRSKLHNVIFFSVLAVGERHIFHASPSRVRSEALTLDFTYVPTIPGNYSLYVEEISKGYQKQLSGSPFHLIVEGPPINQTERQQKADQLPSCQTLPQTDLSWLEGEWVTRDIAGENRGTLRSGWVLQPYRCSIDIFTKGDLALAAASPSLKTIVVLGRSTERGVFLSLVDLLLKSDEKASIYTSVLWKCWGIVEVRLGNLRFIYQDFRIESVSPETVTDREREHVNVTCHNKQKVRSNEYFRDTITFFQKTLFNDKINPDVVLLTIKYSKQLQLLAKNIPASWRGNLYAMNGFKVHEGLLYTFTGRQSDLEMAKQFVTYDDHIRALDGFALATPWRHATEIPPLVMKTPHWHRPCEEQDGEIRVCGDATEMVAQILLGRALAPNGKEAWLASLDDCKPNNIELSRHFTVCNDCPNYVFPLHFNPVPQLKCYSSTSLKIRNLAGVQPKKLIRCPSK
ncbi:uncharacterized protein [Apostichopus japonicus]|uniref:uncharacterized protein n=1 Tax=Stichopus japonicus TaxID=307972 RepID=UPI003AB6CEA5